MRPESKKSGLKRTKTLIMAKKEQKHSRIRDIELSVVTITYNEKDNIKQFIEEVNRQFNKHNLPGEIIVVDDNSPDGTAQLVQELKETYPRTILITRPTKSGIGSAYKTGIESSHGKIIATLDADLSHPPDILNQMYTLAKENKIMYGSRYIKDTVFETDLAHKIGTKILNLWVKAWLQTGIKDHTLGYIMLPKEKFDEILNYGTQKNIFPFERILYGIPFAAIATKLSIPLLEIKAPYLKRQHGSSKIPFLKGLKIVYDDLKYTLKIRKKIKNE